MMNMKFLIGLLCLGFTSYSFGKSNLSFSYDARVDSGLVYSAGSIYNERNDSISNLSIDTTPTSTAAMNAVCACPSATPSMSNYNNDSVIMD